MQHFIPAFISLLIFFTLIRIFHLHFEGESDESLTATPAALETSFFWTNGSAFYTANFSYRSSRKVTKVRSESDG